MDYHRPDPDTGSLPSGARVEDDFVRPLRPMRGGSHLRLPAAMPFAFAAILVVSPSGAYAYGPTTILHLIVP